MITINEAYVDSLALNAAAVKNGRDLVKKNKITKRCRTEDRTLLFGDCQGSGKEPYRCSVDYLKPESPVFRCTCPSRQFPCKHILGLLYASAAGQSFSIEAVPQEIAEKRDKADKREEKKKEAAGSDDAAVPKRKTNKAALLKKINAQLEGIELCDKLIRQLVQNGLAGIDSKALKMMDDQAKQLGNFYIPGIQNKLRELILLIKENKDRESWYTEAMDQLTYLHALLKKSGVYLTSRQQNPELAMDTDSGLEEAIGHAWQLAELRDCGRMQTDVELAQLTFRSKLDAARSEYVDEGFWLDMDSGKLYTTRHYRPIKAAKHMKEEDSVFDIVRARELFTYPGELNPRIRWEDGRIRSMQEEDFDRIYSYSRGSFTEVIKLVKNQLKNPLSDKHPVALLRYSEIVVGDDESYVLLDEQGKQIALHDTAYLDHATTHLLSLLTPELAANQAMLVLFEHDLSSGRLIAQPLSLVTKREILRFIY
ncbi:SWIM zinc finger family protein [Paenibacillus radicis (ex Xue et al. 2023)]|uniref:SWIM zinc finger domain-containing protein n=1 Tax=Paenibacillus radicis (ex Xue et al. 2023) TaxID=2972489 RepID=A0ABT1YA04_9BACL|nr:SWIM zinc finger family protein [Paenibacillus radicis (ex Xue et al. 2023)]MCR8630017.1 SWIM zinc finger domain-containing protein [Paenibacillus radicis (ex Xue et al. 2023)]